MLSSEDIKKSLECCYAFDVMFCDKCPNKETCGEIDVIEVTINLLNTYEKRIEELEDKLSDIEANDYY